MNSEIRVPEGMLNAADNCYGVDDDRPWDAYKTSDILEAALRWLSEHPIVPTEEKVDEILSRCGLLTQRERRIDAVRVATKHAIVDGQRRMFRAEDATDSQKLARLMMNSNSGFLEAYRLGHKSR